MPKLVPLPDPASRTRVRRSARRWCSLLRPCTLARPDGPTAACVRKFSPMCCCSGFPLVLIVVVAAVLRFVWVADIEFKADERWTYERMMDAKRGGEWPRLGMPTSQTVPNPGMSVWVFVALGWASGAETPTELARVCQWTNLLAVIGLIAFTRLCVPRESRGIWFWAAAVSRGQPDHRADAAEKSGRHRCVRCSSWGCWLASGTATAGGGRACGVWS